MATFDLLPAIDLLGGRVVRLRQGDFFDETAFSDDPVAVALEFVEAGARWLHVVDLDGARAGAPVHASLVVSIIQAVGEQAFVEVAGGIRSADLATSILDAGAARVVLGTAALSDPGLAASLIQAHGVDRVAVALDVRAGQAVGHGWVPGAPGMDVGDALAQLADAGIRWLEVTGIERDGSLEGPDLELLRSVVERAPVCRVIASGGIRTVEDLLATWTMGCAGAIVGRAIYEGSFDLGRAIRATAVSPSGLVERPSDRG